MAQHWRSSFALVACAVLLDDQVTKAIAQHRGLVANNAAYALGVVGGPPLLLCAGALAVLVAFLVFVVPRAAALGVPSIASGLIVGGILGNTVDRMRLGAARDFLVTPWAIINLADIAVATGLVVLVVASVLRLGQARRAAEPGSIAAARDMSS